MPDTIEYNLQVDFVLMFLTRLNNYVIHIYLEYVPDLFLEYLIHLTKIIPSAFFRPKGMTMYM